MNRAITQDSGASLLELLAVVLIMAIAASITMPILQKQIAAREIDLVTRRFISHAHFARQQALHLGESIKLEPRLDGNWNAGWTIQNACIASFGPSNCTPKIWLTHPKLDPVFIKEGTKYFVDPHTKRAGILFNAAGAAKTTHGGFVANRLIFGHQRSSDVELHLILGSGGRWRICDPRRDVKRCH